MPGRWGRRVAKALITSVPFGTPNRLPLELLENAGIEYLINPHSTKLTEGQLAELVTDFDTIIAGTEPITDRVMARASKLKHISRIGIGLDSVDLIAAKRRGIRVSYTPDAPAPAVAELTLCLMLALLRSVHVSNAHLHRGAWQRLSGRRLAEITVGIIGAGRIGTRVLRRITAFGTRSILVNDIVPNDELSRECELEWVTKEQIYKRADIVSLHVPLTPLTKNLITREQLLSMKPDALLINTARGGIVNEQDLYDVMTAGHLSGAALDVFEKEPYVGKLAGIERCLLTAHMGSMSVDCRSRMEMEATEEAIGFLMGKPLEREVPQMEYDIQCHAL
jgi:D-3-phosphoglycerate dehydrogenase